MDVAGPDESGCLPIVARLPSQPIPTYTPTAIRAMSPDRAASSPSLLSRAWSPARAAFDPLTALFSIALDPRERIITADAPVDCGSRRLGLHDAGVATTSAHVISQGLIDAGPVASNAANPSLPRHDRERGRAANPRATAS